MKKINSLLILILLSTSLISQDLSFINSIDKIKEQSNVFYSNIDESTMQTNVFFNKGFLVLNDLEKSYNKIPFIINNKHWLYLYNSLSKSFIDNAKLQQYTLLMNNIKQMCVKDNNAVISILFYKGDYLDIESLQKSRRGNFTPIFKQVNLFAGAVFNNYFSSSSINFVFDSKFFISNKGKDIKKFLINFDDGEGYYSTDVHKNQVYNINYSCQGEKSICFKIITNNDDTLISYTKINVMDSFIEPTFKGYIAYNDTNNFTLFKEYENIKSNLNSDPNINLSYANYEYFEGCDGVLNKPVIITEGFDIIGDMSASELYNGFYNNNNILVMEKWKTTIDYLNARGYDVFCVNYRAPDHKLQKNATIIKSLIKSINNVKQYNFEGIYIGESMGGIIGRIALKQLEDESYDHKFGLYVSWDSPHKGAYIPIALQYALKDLNWMSLGSVFAVGHLTDLVEEIFGWDIPYADIHQMLNSNSAKQMLVKHYNDWGVSNHVTFQTYLDNLGYPSECRNITFSNGSNTGNSLGITDKHFFHTAIPTPIIIFPYNIYITMDGWFPTVGSGGQEYIANTKINFDTWPNWLDFSIRKKHYYDLKPISYYNSPGGYMSGGFEILDIQIANADKFSFVPTVSAIGYTGILHQTDMNDYNVNSTTHDTQCFIDNNLTPFDDIYAGSYNSWHTDQKYTTVSDIRNQEVMYDNMYIQNRIIDKVRDFEARDKIVVGKNISGVLTNNSHTKHIKQNNVIIRNGTTVTMQAGEIIEFEDGFEVEEGASFEATVGTDPCSGNTKTIEQIIIPPHISGRNTVCGSPVFNTECSGNCEIEWQLTGENTSVTASGTEFSIDSLPYGQYTIYCTKITDKGTVTRTKVIKVKCNTLEKTLEQQMYANKQLQKEDIVLYPNPANTEFTILINSKNEINFSVEIKDIFGKIVKAENNLSNNSKLNIKELSAGIYFVKIKTNGNEVVKKLIIN